MLLSCLSYLSPSEFHTPAVCVTARDWKWHGALILDVSIQRQRAHWHWFPFVSAEQKYAPLKTSQWDCECQSRPSCWHIFSLEWVEKIWKYEYIKTSTFHRTEKGQTSQCPTGMCKLEICRGTDEVMSAASSMVVYHVSHDKLLSLCFSWYFTPPWWSVSLQTRLIFTSSCIHIWDAHDVLITTETRCVIHSAGLQLTWPIAVGLQS